MSASTTRQSVIVGLFVTAGVAMLAGGVLTIGDLNDTFTRKLGASAVFTEVGGLKRGDNVWFSGVKVGVVDDIAFLPGSQVEVDLRIDRDAARFIPVDSLAKVSSDGLIGNKIIVLYGGTPGGAPVTDGATLAVGEALNTEEIMATLQKNNENMLAVTTDLKALTSAIANGEGTAGKLLKDDALYTSVSATMASLESASSDAAGATRSLSRFTASLNQEGNLAHDLVTDGEIYPSLKQTAVKASAMVDGLAVATANPDSAFGALVHDEAAGADVKAALDNLNRGSALLAEDLEAVQHNFLLRGFFKKKEKAEKKAREESGVAPEAPRDEPDPEPTTPRPASR